MRKLEKYMKPVSDMPFFHRVVERANKRENRSGDKAVFINKFTALYDTYGGECLISASQLKLLKQRK